MTFVSESGVVSHTTSTLTKELQKKQKSSHFGFHFTSTELPAAQQNTFCHKYKKNVYYNFYTSNVMKSIMEWTLQKTAKNYTCSI
jgi:hypothetical protein